MRNIYIIRLKKRYVKLFITTLMFVFVTMLFLKNPMPFSHTSKNFFAVFSGSLNSGVPYSENMQPAGKLAIVIDDFGQDRSGVEEMMSIDRRLTFAVMPFLEYSNTDANNAFQKGYEVIVHLPMEPNKGKLSWVGPRPILVSMSSEDIRQLVLDAFDSVPHAVGANVHMGSKASGDERVMSVILDVINEKELFFVDSYTANRPVAKKLADQKGIFCFNRDIFLDGKVPKQHIKKQLSKAGDIALKKGKALAIGHVGTEGGKVMAQAIVEMLPEFDRRNIEIVFASELQ